MDIEKLINRFQTEFATLNKVDHSLLIHRNYNIEEINVLIEAGILKPIKPYDSDSAFADEVAYLISI